MDVGFGLLPGDGSAVNWAAKRGHLDIVKRLVLAGAKTDIDAKKPAWLGGPGALLSSSQWARTTSTS
ncbi:hypothetical protein B0H63DRAFT_488204 [Podospora didyma]|uniref:Ankyrin n=1 Tax=Podospora didyma TaxID=330526 RepID=A0AAE0N2H2_9PEZI|nr:hypothetical protein B0H63DRAFT_488204 [Podospora didyma]